MSGNLRGNALIAALVVVLTVFFAPLTVQTNSGNVVLWNKLDGGTGGSPSEIGPQLYDYHPSVDGGTDCCDVIGTVQYVPGKFGDAASLGAGGYYSGARVHALMLRNLNTVLNPEQGTIAVWYNEKSRPAAYSHNLYRIFDGGFGLDSPVDLWVCDASCYGGQHNKLILDIRFSGQTNTALADFTVNLNEWVHVAAVWDRKGIEGTSEKVRLYINGVKVTALQSNSWGTGFNGNHADIAGGNDNIANAFAIDNLVIYDYAKTDFSDRSAESPITASPFCKGKLSAKVTTSGFLYSRKTKTYLSTVTVKNMGLQYVNGPVSVVFANLPTGVSLVNPSGTSLGSPYAVIPSLSAAPDVFAPNQSVSFPVQFNATAPINFSNTVCSGSLNP